MLLKVVGQEAVKVDGSLASPTSIDNLVHSDGLACTNPHMQEKTLGTPVVPQAASLRLDIPIAEALSRTAVCCQNCCSNILGHRHRFRVFQN